MIFSFLLKIQKSDLKITVGHRRMSDQNQKLSDQTKNTQDIMSDGKNLRQNQMSDQIMHLPDQTFDQRKLMLSNKYIAVLKVMCTNFIHFPLVQTT